MASPLRHLLPVAMATSNAVLACSCFGPQTFCETLNPQPPQFPEPEWWIPSDIILAVKLGDHEYAADVKVLQVFSGNLQVADEIRVWGDCGLLCRHYVNGNVGDTVLWAIQHCDLMGNGSCGTSFEDPGDYQLSICGIYWLGYANGVVSGPLTEAGAEQSVGLGEFQALVDGCLSTGIRPVPAPDPINIRYDGGAPIISLRSGTADIILFDQLGQAVIRRMWNGQPWRLDALSAGIFTLVATRADQRWSRKLIIH
jgi:hypothetical protein